MDVSDDLHLDVAGPREVALDVALVPTEALESFALGRHQGLFGLSGRLDHAHPAPTAPVGGLDGDWPAELVAEGDDLGGVVQALGRPGTPATPAACAAIRLDTLSPMTSMAPGGGPTKATPRSVMARAKSVFSEKKP